MRCGGCFARPLKKNCYYGILTLTKWQYGAGYYISALTSFQTPLNFVPPVSLRTLRSWQTFVIRLIHLPRPRDQSFVYLTSSNYWVLWHLREFYETSALTDPNKSRQSKYLKQFVLDCVSLTETQFFPPSQILWTVDVKNVSYHYSALNGTKFKIPN